MKKIKTYSNDSISFLEWYVNEFIKDKDVISVVFYWVGSDYKTRHYVVILYNV